MIVVTGAAGFIGSCLVGKLNREGLNNIVVVDEFDTPAKQNNLKGKLFTVKMPRQFFINWFENNHHQVDFVYHLGARTDTTETDTRVFEELNVQYSKDIWRICSGHDIPLVYASSAATYGDGRQGYEDDHDVVGSLKPLNAYGRSKQEFDEWALAQDSQPSFWAGLKFFNVYGPDEYHKGRMASVVYHAYHQIKETGKVKLFRSHRGDYEDGKQLRDFIYVKDVLDICHFLHDNRINPGLYNIGTGTARTFVDLVSTVFAALDKEENVEFIDIPEDIRDKYQYFTEAKMDKLRKAGYSESFYSLEEGVGDYVRNYLVKESYY